MDGSLVSEPDWIQSTKLTDSTLEAVSIRLAIIPTRVNTGRLASSDSIILGSLRFTLAQLPLSRNRTTTRRRWHIDCDVFRVSVPVPSQLDTEVLGLCKLW